MSVIETTAVRLGFTSLDNTNGAIYNNGYWFTLFFDDIQMPLPGLVFRHMYLPVSLKLAQF